MDVDVDRQVFLAYRAIFTGKHAQIRKASSIKNRLARHKGSNLSLLESLAEDKVVERLRLLLADKVFESVDEAKIRFPELYKTTRAQQRQHHASEAEAAKSEAKALNDVAAVEDDPRYQKEVLSEVQDKDTTTPANVEEAGTGSFSLYPVYFPYSTQYMILTKAQKLLEECCYDFSVRRIPIILAQNGWDCAEAIELNKWAPAVIKQLPRLPPDCFASDVRGSSLAQKLNMVNQLRHAAVHRLQTTANGVLGMLGSAIDFSHLLQDHDCEERFKVLYAEVKHKKQALELNKNFLESKWRQELAEINRIREKLDLREQRARDGAKRDDNEHLQHISDLLTESVQYIFHNVDHGKLSLPEANNDSDIEPDVAQLNDEARNGRVVPHWVQKDSHDFPNLKRKEPDDGLDPSENEAARSNGFPNKRWRIAEDGPLLDFPPFKSSSPKPSPIDENEPSPKSPSMTDEADLTTPREDIQDAVSEPGEIRAEGNVMDPPSNTTTCFKLCCAPVNTENIRQAIRDELGSSDSPKYMAEGLMPDVATIKKLRQFIGKKLDLCRTVHKNHLDRLIHDEFVAFYNNLYQLQHSPADPFIALTPNATLVGAEDDQIEEGEVVVA